MENIFKIIIIIIIILVLGVGIAQLVWRLATGWATEGSEFESQ
jgi:flagellar basal body-associated protein FliL